MNQFSELIIDQIQKEFNNGVFLGLGGTN